MKFDDTEGTVLSVLTSDDEITKLSLLVPSLTAEFPPTLPIGFVTVHIFSVWSPSQCTQCPDSVLYTTDGAILQIYPPVIPISVSPSTVICILMLIVSTIKFITEKMSLPLQGPVFGGNAVQLLFTGGAQDDFISSSWISTYFEGVSAQVKFLESGTCRLYCLSLKSTVLSLMLFFF